VRDLEVALAVARAGSTSRAASALHLSQSAVSRALLLAEQKLGVQLFERTVRGLSPTVAGARLIEGAGPLLSQLASLEQDVSVEPEQPTKLRMVCECYTAYRWLPSTLSKLKLTLPQLDVSLALERTHDPVEALLAEDIDIALLTTSAIKRPLVEVPLFADEVVFVVGKSHPLAAKKAISASDLQAYPLISATGTPVAEARWLFSRVFGRARPRLSFLRFPLTEAIMDATRAGMGIAVMSEWIASGYVPGGDLLVKRFAKGPLCRPWRIAFRPPMAGVAKRLHAALSGAAPRLVVS
jgi:LysR family transcriptional regulator, regulator for metE and metH